MSEEEGSIVTGHTPRHRGTSIIALPELAIGSTMDPVQFVGGGILGMGTPDVYVKIERISGLLETECGRPSRAQQL